MKYENNEINEKIIRDSYKDNTKLHLKLYNNSWRNGYIADVHDSFFTIIDKINGVENIFFAEVKEVKPYIEKEGVNNGTRN